MEAWRKELYLAHHGIKGQQWGVRRGPPYPLDAKTKRVGVKRPSCKMSSADTRNGKAITKKALIAIGATAAVAVCVGVAVKLANGKSVSSVIDAVKTVEDIVKQNADVSAETLDDTISAAEKVIKQNVATSQNSSAKVFPNAKELSQYIKAIHEKTLENDVQGKLFDGSYWESLTKDQQNAIVNYTYEYSKPNNGMWTYKAINGFLRYGDKTFDSDEAKRLYRKDVEKAVADCTNAINGSILKEDVVSFRGFSYDRYKIREMLGLDVDIYKPLSKDVINELRGREFTEKGFYSSSIDPESGLSGLLITTIIPKGTKAMYIAPVSQKTDERELLIQRGTTFVIKSVTTNKKGLLEGLTVEVVNQL